MSRASSINNMNQEPVMLEFNRQRLSQMASMLAEVFGRYEPFSKNEAKVLLETLYTLNPSGVVQWLGREDEFAETLSKAAEKFQAPGAKFSVEESVYKEWTNDSTHPLAGKKGFSQGDPAVHMMELFDRYGLERRPDQTLAPDHLSVLLEFLSIFLETRPDEEIRAFCQDHLDWFPALKEKMEQIQTDEILFHLVEAVENLIDLCKNSGTLENTGDILMADDKEKTEGLEDQEKSSELSGAQEENNVHSVNNEIAKKRGRMVAAGVVVSVALCVIAILVAAIFNLTVTWFNKCPEDMAVNDPAPVLWNKLVAEKSIEAEKGLPESLKKYGSLKTSGK